ncbi:ADP-specific Phosphofructokinase/Glucokinase conserved region family protein [Aphelenchoides avenae]|nr:ADP-specific Phosphofructokinase/Glucokinase conserved region family protein [Aphelenchus avenae]
MRRAWLPLRQSIRGVRRRLPPPVEWLKDATTYSDVHTVINDPLTRLPYKEEELHDFAMEKEEERSKKKSPADKAREKQRQKAMDASSEISFDHVPIEDQVFVLFPGQGSQKVGMGEKVLDHPPSAELFKQASEILGYDLLQVCTKGPKSKLDQTIYTQPAIFVSSLAAMQKLRSEQADMDDRITHVAGFSIGELAALVTADVLQFEDALKIVKVRAEAMHDCSQLVPSGMVTVRTTAASRLDDAMKEACDTAGESGEKPLCEVSNYLFSGVKVIGASNVCINFLESNADRYKFQVVKRLDVSGAFHTQLMDPAAKVLDQALKDVRFGVARANVYSNYTGRIYPRKPEKIRECIAKQVNNPVKWEQIMQLIYRKHQDYKFPSFFEVGPGRQLGATLLQTSKKAFGHYVSYPC